MSHCLSGKRSDLKILRTNYKDIGMDANTKGWNDSSLPGVPYIRQLKLSMVYYYSTQDEYA